MTRVGIVGAGLMAAQLALLFAQRLSVPVIMRDLDDERVTQGLAHVHGALDKLVSTGRMQATTADQIYGQVCYWIESIDNL